MVQSPVLVIPPERGWQTKRISGGSVNGIRKNFWPLTVSISAFTTAARMIAGSVAGSGGAAITGFTRSGPITPMLKRTAACIAWRGRCPRRKRFYCTLSLITAKEHYRKRKFRHGLPPRNPAGCCALIRFHSIPPVLKPAAAGYAVRS